DAVWLYDIDDQTYMPSDPLPAARCYHSLVNVAGCLYSVGGHSAADPDLGVNLLRNCSPSMLTSVPQLDTDGQRPYSAYAVADGFQIQFTDPAHGANVSIEVLDAAGKRVSLEQAVPASGTHRIPCAGLRSGAYLVVIRIGSATYIEKWMVPGPMGRG
ncbi:MAG TPA: T9SS type A sorting domain-containing protein, partial [Flavobacteriales bacterium]|nr:T9SS type A sorting domain-containing protein [Flavobacteriales bacterium]